MLTLGLGLFLSNVASQGPGGVPGVSVAPVISGTGLEGQTLSTTDGTWNGSPSSYAYQWQRNGVDIGSATASTYVLVTADAGKSITCNVTASNGAGAGAAAASNAIVPFGIPVSFGFNSISTSGTTVTYTSTSGQARVIGEVVYVLVQFVNNSFNISSVTDSVGNTYTGVTQLNAGGTIGRVRMFSSKLTVDAPVGTVWTATVSGSTINARAMLIAAALGCNVVDKQLQGSSGTSTSASTATGTLAAPRELIVAGLRANTATFTAPAGWVNLNSASAIAIAYTVTTATTDTSPIFTLSGSDIWGIQMISYTSN